LGRAVSITILGNEDVIVLEVDDVFAVGVTRKRCEVEGEGLWA
jgi:hypothetical protein